MVTFPPEFIATKYPGYFWHHTEKKLYTLKVTGILRPIKYSTANRWTHFREGYRVSVNGDRRWLTTEYLQKLTPTTQVVPVAS